MTDGPGWSLEKQHIMYWGCFPAYILSIMGSSFIIINFISFSELRTFSFKLVFFIAISDLIRAIAMIIPAYYDDNLNKYLCWIQSIMGNTAGLSTTLWNASVAHSIRYVFTSRKIYTTKQTNRLFYKYLIINLTLTIILSIPPIFPLNKNHAYALAGSWCWIKDEGKYDSAVRIISQYDVQIICGLYIIYVYWHFMRKLFNSTSSRSVSSLIQRLKWYPLVLLITYVPGIVNRFSQIFNSTHNAKYELTFFQYASLSVCGFLDSLIYAWTKPVKEKYKQLCKPWPRHMESETRHYADLSDLDDTLNDGTGVDTVSDTA
eukprot:534046_1